MSYLASASITCCFRVKPQILQGCSSPFCLDDIKGKTNLRNQVRVACFALGMRDGGGVRGNNWILKNYWCQYGLCWQPDQTICREINLSLVVYSTPSQTSMVKLFTKIVNDFSPVTVFAKKIYYKCDALRNLVASVQFKNLKNNFQ